MSITFRKSKWYFVLNAVYLLVLIGLIACLFAPFSIKPIDYLQIDSKQKNIRNIILLKNESGSLELIYFSKILDGTETGMDVSLNDKPMFVKNEFAPYASNNYCYINLPNIPWHKFQYSYRHVGASSFAWTYSDTFVISLPIWFIIIILLMSRWILFRVSSYFKLRQRGFEIGQF